MAKKCFKMGILVVLLMFGMLIIGCDDSGNGSGAGSGNGVINPFIGTWRANHLDAVFQLTFNADLTVVSNWFGSTTYTFSGNTATLNIAGPSNITISGNSFTWQEMVFVRQ